MIKLINRLLNLSDKYKGQIKAAFVLAVFESMCAKMPIFYALIILIKFNQQSLTAKDCLMVGVLLVVTVAVQMLLRNFMDRLQSAAGLKIFTDKRMELGDHLRKLPMGYYTRGNLDKISSVLTTDMVFIEEVSMAAIANMMSYIFSSILMVLFMFYLDVRLGIVATVVSLLVKLIADKMNKLSLKNGRIRQDQSEFLTDSVISFVEGIGVIKSFNLVGEKSGQLQSEFANTRDRALEFEHKMTPWMLSINIILAIGTAVIFGLAVWLKGQGELSLSYMLGVLLFVFDLFGPIKALYNEATRLTVMDGCLNRIEEVFGESTLPDSGTKTLQNQGETPNNVAFENVSFSYGKEEVLHNVSFEMKPNSMTALVGASGSGKSTIANLLARFWDIKKGSISIGGIDIRDIPMEELMNQISMVFQRVYLFEDTVFNNILMGKPNATKEEVVEAAKKARCYDFIMELENGFDTVIGEGGESLSGGEKQRISIARCILKDAPIVILDEATASVDADNESYIQQAIAELVKGKTLLVIAHRINTIKVSDQILVIDNGTIAERGTHENLLKNNGTYKKYYETVNRNNTLALNM